MTEHGLSGRPLGQLFTDTYRDRGEARNDDARFRVQIHEAFCDIFHDHRTRIASHLRRYSGTGPDEHEGFEGYWYDYKGYLIHDCPIDDLLDFITHVYKFARIERREDLAEVWIQRVQGTLSRRRMAYEIDEKGGMHHRVDAAFQRSKELTIACLAGTDFEAAQAETEAAFNFLTTVHFDTKMAVVNIFLAAENIFKLKANTGSDLTKAAVEKHLLPFVQRVFADGDHAVIQSTARLTSSFGAWADACHPYRHGQKNPGIVAPPMDLAIALVTSGADHLRWIVSLPTSSHP
jgi:hypothetical protein